MFTYKNPFYSPYYQNSEPVIDTDVKPVEYKGYLIFHRLKSTSKGGDIFDIVLNGKIIGMNAGINGAKKRINDLAKRIKTP